MVVITNTQERRFSKAHKGDLERILLHLLNEVEAGRLTQGTHGCIFSVTDSPLNRKAS